VELPRNASTSPSFVVADERRLHDALAGEHRAGMFRALWEMAAEPMALLDRDGVVLVVNSAYLDLYAYAPEDVMGHNFTTTFVEEQRRAAFDEYHAVFEDPTPSATLEGRVRRKDGTERVVEISVGFIVDGGGHRAAMLNVLRDVTERRRSEELAHHVEQDRALLFAIEHTARVDAEQALKVRDELLATIAHDLLNSMTALRGSAQLLRRRVERLGADTALGLASLALTIEATSDQVSVQLGELLDTAVGGTREKANLVRQPVDLVVLVREVLAAYTAPLAAHPLRFETQEQALIGLWDREQLRRMLANLLMNAVKYSADGTEVLVQVSRDSDRIAVLEVCDRGVGIAAADLPHVFERYYRGASATGSVAGSGLGLASVLHTVEQLGGTIAVESKEADGSRFTVRLPLEVH
jgi:PAS domain S-box-containing protein